MISFAFITSFLFVILVTLPVPNSSVILLPDEDGTVGEISVSNKNSTQILTQAYTSIEVINENSALKSKTVDKSEILEMYQSTLSSKPKEVSNFVLYFQSGSNELTNESTLKIPNIISEIASRKTYNLYVVGHTDTVGSADDNYRLGLKRAAVLKQIVISSMPGNRNIEVSSHGEGNPLVLTKDNVAEEKNRRVEIEIH